MQRESAQAKTERILGEELRRLGWTEADWERRHKGEPENLVLAARVRAETTLTTTDITARLHLGTWKTASVRLSTRTLSLHGPERVASP